jgi:hypothetical protein
MENIKNQLLAQRVAIVASTIIKVVDENKLSQESDENELWKLGYHEACDMILEHLKQFQN